METKKEFHVGLKNLNINISSDVIEAMQEQAKREGVHIPEFVSLCIQIAMGRVAGECKNCGSLVKAPITGTIPTCPCGEIFAQAISDTAEDPHRVNCENHTHATFDERKTEL